MVFDKGIQVEHGYAWMKALRAMQVGGTKEGRVKKQKRTGPSYCSGVAVAVILVVVVVEIIIIRLQMRYKSVNTTSWDGIMMLTKDTLALKRRKKRDIPFSQ